MAEIRGQHPFLPGRVIDEGWQLEKRRVERRVLKSKKMGIWFEWRGGGPPYSWFNRGGGEVHLLIKGKGGGQEPKKRQEKPTQGGGGYNLPLPLKFVNCGASDFVHRGSKNEAKRGES